MVMNISFFIKEMINKFAIAHLDDVFDSNYKVLSVAREHSYHICNHDNFTKFIEDQVNLKNPKL